MTQLQHIALQMLNAVLPRSSPHLAQRGRWDLLYLLIHNRFLTALLFGALAICAGAIVAVGVIELDNPLLPGVLVAGIIGVLIILQNAQFGALVLVFVTYTNFSDVLIKFHGAPSIARPLIGLLIVTILLRWRFHGERPRNWQLVTALMVGYGLTQLPSLLYAADFSRSLGALNDYVRDALITIILAILIQRGETLRWVVWIILLSGLFVSSISVLQYATGTFDNAYGGFGKAGVAHIIGETNDFRVAGPIGDPNFYAQILVFAIPLALERFWNERTWYLRSLALICLGIVGLALVLTFSRGGFLAMIAALGVLLLRRPPSLPTMLVGVLLLAVMIQFAPATYTDRLMTIADSIPGLGDVRSEGSFRGRASESISALMMFADRPLFGVGVQNYAVYYQEYSRQLGLDVRRTERSAHSLYLQLAAEKGLFGLAVFGTMMGVLYVGMWRAEQRLRAADQSQLADMIAALSAGLSGYLFAAIFLHLAYPRYLWMFVGIVVASIHVARNELKELETRGSQN